MRAAVACLAALAAATAVAGTYPLETATIVRAARETRVQAAADELARHLRLMWGHPVAEAATPGEGLSFVFGKPDGAPEAGPFESRYRIAGNRVWFWGGEGRGFPGVHPGSRHAVYGFLKNELGVRWTEPGDIGIAIARADALTLPDERDDSYTMPFRQEILRTFTSKTMTVPSMPILPDFVSFDPVPPRIRLSEEETTAYCLNTSDLLVRHRLFSPDQISYGHAFTAWQDRFYGTHPEYLALDEHGNRGSPGYGSTIKLCVSNPDVHAQILADWQAEGCPRYLNVCENDGGGFCRCANCCALDEDAPGEDFLATKSDRYLWFANRIAEQAVKIRPDVQVVSYIYSYYRHPPRRERIEHPDNMVFGAVPSLADDIRAFFEGWKQVGLSQFFFRPNFHTSLGTLPRGTEKAIYDAFQVGVEYGLVGCDFDAYNWRSVMAPDFYVTMRMMAEPTAGFAQLMDEYCSAYGAAASAVSAYYGRIRARYESESDRIREAAERENPLDDSGFTSTQLDIHTEAELREDVAVLEAARPLLAASPERTRLDQLIVRARHYVLCCRFLEAGRHTDDAALAAAGHALLDYRVKHRDTLADAWEQVMNSRYSGTEGALWKRIPETLRQFGGLTERTDETALTDETVAFYPFGDKAAGTEADGQKLANAVAGGPASGVCAKSSAAGSVMRFSDERPARYVFSRRGYKAPLLATDPRSIQATVPGRWDAVGGGSVAFPGLMAPLVGASGWTVEFFCRYDQAHSSYSPLLRVPVLRDGTEDSIVVCKTDDSRLRIKLDSGASWTTILTYGGTFSDGLWHHLALVYDGTNVALYGDRSRKVSFAAAGLAADPDAPVTLFGDVLHGYATCLRVSSRALAPRDFLFASGDPDCLPREAFRWTLDGVPGEAVTALANADASAVADWKAGVAKCFFWEDLSALGGDGVAQPAADDGRLPVRIATPLGGGVRLSVSAAAGEVLAPRLVQPTGTVRWMDPGSMTFEALVRFDRDSFLPAWRASGRRSCDCGVLGAYAGNGDRPWLRVGLTVPVQADDKETVRIYAAKADWKIDEIGVGEHAQAVLSDGAWHHVCLQYAAINNRLTFYADYTNRLCEVTLTQPLMTPDDDQLYFLVGSTYGLELGAFDVDGARLMRGLVQPDEQLRATLPPGFLFFLK